MHINMLKFFLTFVMLSCLIVNSAAQNPAVDAFINAEMATQKIPGVSLAVVKDGQTAIARGYGLANLEHKIAVKPETIFQSGSVGKQFTAMAVMMLVEEGRIKLDAPISTYLGQVPPGWRCVTVRHLLTHTCGFSDYPEDFDYRREYNEDELLDRAKKIPLAFAPGEKWS
jgi:CubicO group peptidase (beta-lactamase class C family)